MSKFAALLNKYRRLIVPAVMIGFFVLTKVIFFKLDYDRFHVLVSLSTFFIYFTALIAIAGYFIRKQKLIAGNIMVFLILAVLVEMIFYFLSGMPKKEWKNFTEQKDKNHISYHLGDVPWADSVMHSYKEKDGHLVYDVNYSIDSLNRRITPGYDSSRNKYALFFGCSVCFGFGLKDDQTLPYYFQQHSHGYNAYNYAYSGWGPHHMLSRLEYRDLSEEIREKDGLAIYVFLWSHIRRAIGDMRVYTNWGHTMPYYSLENGEAVRKGNFFSGRGFVSRLYELLYRSYTFRYLDLNLPFFTTHSDYVLVAEIIEKAKEEYARQFGNRKFYVLIHPMNWDEFTKERKLEFIELLKERNIDFIDYSENFTLDLSEVIRGDGHPNQKVYDRIGRMLNNDLHTTK